MRITQQDLLVLQLVHSNPGCSTNWLYMRSCPAARGRKKSMGTSAWTRPHTMEARGLVTIQEDRSRILRPYFDRHKVRYHWYLTPLGQQVVANNTVTA
jgi:hypothetical protein